MLVFVKSFMKYLKPSFYISYILFYLGHWFSLVFETESAGGYTVYSRLMRGSSWVQGKGEGPWQTLVLSEDELEAFLKEHDNERV